MPSHVVLIGLPGAGKTTVGQLLADRLGAPSVDVDTLIVRREGMPIAAIFGARGEAGFRDVERTTMAEVLTGPPSVIVPGAGWAAQEGQLQTAFPMALVVYLETSPEVAVRRLDGATDQRPLLAAGEPLDRMRKLLGEREGYYGIAHHRVRTDSRSPEELADELAALARAGAGW